MGAVGQRLSGTWARMVTDGGTVTIPGPPSAGDRMLLIGVWKTYSITVADPSGWTSLGKYADGAVAAGNGTGSMAIQVWYRDWQSGDSNPVIDYSAAPTEGAWVIQAYNKNSGDTWDTPLVVNAAIAAATAWTATSSSTLDVKDGAAVVGIAAFRDDSATMTRGTDALDDDGSPAITWSIGHTESPATHWSSTTGQDASADAGYRLVTTGATGVNLTMSGTLSASESGAAYWVHLSASAPANNVNAALGDLASTATLSSGAGRKGAKAALGTNTAAAPSLAAAGRKGAKVALAASFGTTMAATGRKGAARALGDLASGTTQAAVGRKAARTALGTITATTSMTLTGTSARNVNAALGNLAVAASLAAQGRKSVSRAAGNIALATTLVAQGRKGTSRALGTITSGTSQAATGRKGGQVALGTIQAGTTQALATRKGGRVALGAITASTSQALAARKAVSRPLGDLAVSTTMAATGTQGVTNDRYAALGDLAASTSMAATGRKGAARALGTVTVTASLASGLGRKGGKAALVAAFAPSMALVARKGGRGQATMALEASLAAQARTSRYGVAHQSAGYTMAVLGLPGRAGAAGDIALAYAMAAVGEANQRALTGLEVAGVHQDAYAAGLASGDALAQLSGDTSASTRQDTYQARITEG